MKHAKVTTDKGFKQIKPTNKNYVLTSFNDGDDIKTYYSTSEVCMPLNADENSYRAITLQEDKEYKEKMQLENKKEK